MSSIRLFILSSLDDFGPMHGHRLRLVAEKMQVPLWTDISVGAVYGAMKRLESEGLLRETRSEQEGNRPTRQVFEITEEGRGVLADLRRDGLSEVVFKPDPFDLAFTRLDPKTLKQLPAVLTKRLEALRAVLAERQRVAQNAKAHVNLAKFWVLRHTEYRLEAEIAFLGDLLKAAPDIVADERNPRRHKPKLD